MRLSALPVLNVKYYSLFSFQFFRSTLRRKLLAFALIATLIILPTPELAFTHLPSLFSQGVKLTVQVARFALSPLGAFLARCRSSSAIK